MNVRIKPARTGEQGRITDFLERHGFNLGPWTGDYFTTTLNDSVGAINTEYHLKRLVQDTKGTRFEFSFEIEEPV